MAGFAAVGEEAIDVGLMPSHCIRSSIDPVLAHHRLAYMPAQTKAYAHAVFFAEYACTAAKQATHMQHERMDHHDSSRVT